MEESPGGSIIEPKRNSRDKKATKEETKKRKCCKSYVFAHAIKPFIFKPKVNIWRSNLELRGLHLDSCWVNVGAFGPTTNK